MIEAASRGSWRDLEIRLRPFIARRVSAPDIDDVLQDIFLRMQRGLAALSDDTRFGPWVYQVARSAIAEHRRVRAREPVPSDSLPEPPIVAPSDDESDEIESELASYIAPFVAALPSPYREAITLTELQGLTQKAAAQLLGLSLSGMKSRVQRGRERLRSSLEACCEIALDARGRVVCCERRPDALVPKGCCE